MGVAYEFYLLEPRSCRQSHAYFEGISLARVPCGFSSIAPGCCLSTLLQPERENSNTRGKRCLVEIISRTVQKNCEICEIKTSENLELYGVLFSLL